MSLRENIVFSDERNIEDNKNVSELLRKVNLHYLEDRFKEGIDSILSKHYRNGEEVSGGEWQRIAIARAVNRNSELLILDEPTAALDPIMELEIFKLFNELSLNKTTITISHRLGITKYNTKIIVLEKGNVVGEGTHGELLENNELYKLMFESQSSWYT